MLCVLWRLSCGQEAQEQLQYVSLSQAGCTFFGTDNEPLAVTVETSPAQWAAEASASWVKAEPGEDGTTLVLSVEDNDGDAERKAAVTVTAGQASQTITVYQLAPDLSINRFRKERMFQNGGVVSPSGKYIGGFTNKAMEDNTWEYYPVIIDTETGEKIKLGPFPSALFKCSQPFAITDYGQLFISDHENGGSVIFDLNGDYMLSSIPEGCTNRGNVMGVSGDGSKWVGYAISEKQEGERIGQYRPIIWEDGEARMLSMPEKNFKGEDFSVGAMARGISADGSVIYGTTWDNSDGAMIYWKDGKLQNVGKDIFKLTPVNASDGAGGTYETNLIEAGMYCFAENQNISPNGKWIAGKYREESMDENGLITKGTIYPAFYNTETETTTVMRDYPDCTAVGATDDGIGLIAEGTSMQTSGFLVEIETGIHLGNCLDYIQERWGITVTTGYISYIPAPGDRMLGTMMTTSATGVSFTQFSVSPRPVK